MSVKPLGKRVIIKEIKAEEVTKSGLVLAGKKEESQMAEVIAVSEEVKTLVIGDKVYYKKYSGTKVEFEKEELIIIDEEDILAVIE